MISFIKGLYYDLYCRVVRMLSILKTNEYHPDINKTFVPNTISYLEDLKDLLQTKINGIDLDIDILANNNLYEFNELNEFFQTIELYRFEVIKSYDKADIYFNKKIARIYREIRHLSIPPLIATISNSESYYWYFYIKQKFRWFFHTIGFDQFLHAASLYGTVLLFT